MIYNEEADKFLDDLYQSVGAISDTQKFNLLTLILGGTFCFSHDPSDAQKVAMLEYDLLHRHGLIELTFV